MNNDYHGLIFDLFDSANAKIEAAYRLGYEEGRKAEAEYQESKHAYANDEAYEEGYAAGDQAGFNDGVTCGYEDGYHDGYADGFNAGRMDAELRAAEAAAFAEAFDEKPRIHSWVEGAPIEPRDVRRGALD